MEQMLYTCEADRLARGHGLQFIKKLHACVLSSHHHEADMTLWGSVVREDRALHGGEPIWG